MKYSVGLNLNALAMALQLPKDVVIEDIRIEDNGIAKDLFIKVRIGVGNEAEVLQLKELPIHTLACGHHEICWGTLPTVARALTSAEFIEWKSPATKPGHNILRK